MPICGIYAIENLINGKVYIGQSVDIENRFKMHEWHLKNNCHINRYLQRAFNKHSLANFTFKIIEQCKEEELNEKEIFYINLYRKTMKLYNLTDGGEGNRGHKHTEESRIKMSIARKGKHVGENNSFYGKAHSEDTKKKISLAMFGKPGTWIGKTHSEKSKEKMSESRKGRLIWNKGIPCSEETKQKISLANKGKPSPMKGKPSWNKGKNFSEETRKRMSEAAIRREAEKRNKGA